MKVSKVNQVVLIAEGSGGHVTDREVIKNGSVISDQ